MKTAEIRSRFVDFFARERPHGGARARRCSTTTPRCCSSTQAWCRSSRTSSGDEPAPFKRRRVRRRSASGRWTSTRWARPPATARSSRCNGNFAFGDYFKEGAIDYAWELVTGSEADGGWGFDPDKVWVTALLRRQETIDLWQQVGVPREHIQERGLKDNYWHMGVPGPGGPCSEIYIDRGPAFGRRRRPRGRRGPLPGDLESRLPAARSSPRSARRTTSTSLRPLPSQNIDTGSGLERVALLHAGRGQHVRDRRGVPGHRQGRRAVRARYGADPDDDVRFRVVADHVRSSLMLMTDGVTPGNEARGYVLRRLLRRSDPLDAAARRRRPGAA